MFMPEAVDETSPKARRARVVGELVLAGDRAKLEAYLQENGAPSFLTRPSLAAEVAAALETAKSGARTIVRLDGLGQAGIGVALAKDAGGEPERAIFVGLEPAAPHRITRLSVVEIRGGPGE